jgi:hypothetical protein
VDGALVGAGSQWPDVKHSPIVNIEEATVSIRSEGDSFDHGIILSKLVHVNHRLQFSLVFSAPLPA